MGVAEAIREAEALLPGIPTDEGQDPRWQAITIQHLLEHKGGWNRDRAFDPMFRPLEIATALGKPGPARHVRNAAKSMTIIGGVDRLIASGSLSV